MAAPPLDFCPHPFLDIADYPYTGGQLQSRFCAPVGQNTTCCLPCPITDWVYPDKFNTVTTAANWVGMSSFVCCLFLLLSLAVLPARKTNRHYLTVCLLTAVACFTFAFVIPLAARPQQCHDAITPNNMRSDLTCAFSGAFVLFGGLAATVWVFIRSLSLHLQICWQTIPGKKFFYFSLLGGWGIPIILVALSLAMSGVSYRFGPICHINHNYSLDTLWAPLLGFTGLATILQILTFGYCIRVYLRSLWDPATTSVASSAATSTALPSTHGSYKTLSAKAAYRRVRKVIALQWRGIMVVVILIVTVVYFAVVFMKLDNMTVATQQDPNMALPWLTCLYLSGGNKDQCLDQASALILNEPAVAACLYMIAVMGFWCILFLARWSMLKCWWELLRRPFTSDSDTWVSADARRMSDPRTYEMLTAPPQHYHLARSHSRLVARVTLPGTEKSSPLDDLPESITNTTSACHLSSSAKELLPFYDRSSLQDLSGGRKETTTQQVRPDSQNTARVTFSQDGPMIIAAKAPYSQPLASSEPSIAQAYATPHRLSTNHYNFSRPQTLSSSGSNLRQSNCSGQERSELIPGRNWYGRGNGSVQHLSHSMDQTQCEWDPESTLAEGRNVQ